MNVRILFSKFQNPNAIHNHPIQNLTIQTPFYSWPSTQIQQPNNQNKHNQSRLTIFPNKTLTTLLNILNNYMMITMIKSIKGTNIQEIQHKAIRKARKNEKETSLESGVSKFLPSTQVGPNSLLSYFPFFCCLHFFSFF